MIKRFHVSMAFEGGEGWPNGDWVKYEDMEKLVKEAFVAGMNHGYVTGGGTGIDVGEMDPADVPPGWDQWKKANLEVPD